MFLSQTKIHFLPFLFNVGLSDRLQTTLYFSFEEMLKCFGIPGLTFVLIGLSRCVEHDKHVYGPYFHFDWLTKVHSTLQVWTLIAYHGA